MKYMIVDAFTDRPFAGNPAAVVPLDEWPNDEWLQNVAMEMNLSETAYLVRTSDGFHLRWFTPRVEVDLCGHATLASAKALAHLGVMADGFEIKFATRSGELRVVRRGGRFQMDFPIKPARPAEPPDGLIESLNASPQQVARNDLDYLVELGSESAVRALAPDFKRLRSVGSRGVIVTARSDDSRFDFVSRFFAPGAGIDEDPVTGSAHCCLADYWGRKLGKSRMLGYQASARGGIVEVAVQSERVLLGGDAVVVAEGELRSLPPTGTN